MRDLQNLNETLRVVTDLHDDTCASTFETALADESCQRILHLFSVYLEMMRHECGQLAAFWMSYIDIVEILLGLVRADREGNWHLHLASIREMIPWCFAMDKTNYSRYLPVYYAQMTQLENTSPYLYSHFQKSGFSVQLRQANPFGRISIDQTLEETVSRDTQTSGGTRGFSLNKGAVSRYYLTAEYRTEAIRKLRELISLQSDNIGYADLQPSRIRRDESDATSIVDMLENNWTNPLGTEPSDLVSISTCVAAPPDVFRDLLKARDKGEEAYKIQAKKIEDGSGFHEPIKKLKLKTFSDIRKQTIIKETNKEIVLKADNRVFGQILLIGQNRKLDMIEVMRYPLGPHPWALANGDGTMKKTGKAILGQHLEKETAYIDTVAGSRATIIDAMGIVQKIHGENLTFKKVSEQLLRQLISNSKASERIDVVFDLYKEQSIQGAERVSRGSKDGVVFNQIKPSHRIKNWKRLLASSESKNNLTNYLAESWKEKDSRETLGTISLVVNCGEQCFLITREKVTEVIEVKAIHEEADTQIMIHARHEGSRYSNVVVVSEDTDVFVILLGLHSEIIGTQNTRILLRRGKKNKIRLIDISRLATILGRDLCTALFGVHAWTGCDSVNAFGGQGKVKAINLVRKSQPFREAFMALGLEWSIPKAIFASIQAFTCSMYSLSTKITSVNMMRYEIFRSKQGDVSSGQLPPCQDALTQHTKRANYQAGIWRRSLQCSPDIPDPTDGYGWVISDGQITIQWLTLPPAPEVVLSLLSCKCSRSCNADTCTCIQNGFPCTPACRLQNCTNVREEEDPIQDEEDSESNED